MYDAFAADVAEGEVQTVDLRVRVARNAYKFTNRFVFSISATQPPVLTHVLNQYEMPTKGRFQQAVSSRPFPVGRFQ